MSALEYTGQTEEAILSTLHSGRSGLTTQEAEKRLQEHGPNSLTSHQELWSDVLFRQLKSPFLYLLLGAAALSLMFGEMIDCIMIVIFVVINTSLGFYQEYKSEQTLKLLTGFIKKTSHVLRDGREVTIPSAHIVTG
ncbi:hypothetical protein HYS00_03625, partial [Candidatus Microgenomates bacterium]|nr:hypothetical protein [Candidatus Microgenomates bacterium]